MRRTGLIWAAVLLAVLAAGRDAADDWIDSTEIPPLLTEKSVEVLDREGRLLRAFTVADGLWRLPVRLDLVDRDYLRMLVAYEDKRFWTHPGIDVRSMTRATLQALRRGRIVSGGSTLTMQVARLLEDGTTGQLRGKVRQMRVALALERRLTKTQILELYLNLAPFGGNLEGLRSATFAYFGKEPARLTPAQAALLVALPQAPVARRPDRDPEMARHGRDRVLMRNLKERLLDRETVDAAKTEPVPRVRAPFPAHAAHLADRMRATMPLQQTLRTTIDRELQNALEALAERTVLRTHDRASAAIVVADHRTGEVLAHVGAADFVSDTRFGWVDMTSAPRSPGSTLKPLIYGLAFENGLGHPDTIIDDRPSSFSGYAPVNFDGSFRGPIRMAEALRLSLNVPVVALTEAVGPAQILARLRRAGAEPRLPGDAAAGLAVALGGIGLTLEELVSLYGAMARSGVPMPLVWDRDAPVTGPPQTRVLSASAAWQVGHILSGMPPPPHALRFRMAYKTGTSYGYRDAWAIGFDGQHVVGVWVGRADGTAVPGISGATTAAPLLFEAMMRLKSLPVPLPPPPPAVLPGPTASLPLPLQAFRGGADATAPDDPRLVFPPDGTVLEAGSALALKVRDGTPPFTWLADGAPLVIASRRRETVVPSPPPGPRRIVVIDARGRTAHARVVLSP